ncbi:unnamed protein product [Durusdinium trenchii]|uniref:Uncharacterized protein n=1 Tax=Durusdinium trenchii TaxID=1381693 RepID=A0ABP0PAS6_9DINO
MMSDNLNRKLISLDKMTSWGFTVEKIELAKIVWKSLCETSATSVAESEDEGLVVLQQLHQDAADEQSENDDGANDDIEPSPAVLPPLVEAVEDAEDEGHIDDEKEGDD